MKANFKSTTKIILGTKYFTLCISPLDTKDWDTFSRLSFKTSVMAAVIASACFEGTPSPSNLLTYKQKKSS